MIKPDISHYITYIYSGIFGLAAPDENLIQWISISVAGGGRVVRVKLVRVRGALSLRSGLASPWPVDTIGPMAPSLCSGGYSMYGIGVVDAWQQ